MGYDQRQNLYERIENIRNRPLIVYVTSYRPNASAQIGADVIIEITKQIDAIEDQHNEIDVLIVSNGGDPTVSWRIVSLLRERFEKFNVLLPFMAYSAATLISLGADEIVMHPYSNLGPVDPQLTYQRRIPGQNGPSDAFDKVEFGSEDLKNFIEYAKKDIGISDQEQLAKAFELVCKEVGAIPIGVAKRGSQLALSMGEQLLSLHMTDANKAKAIAEALNSSFYHHGYPLGPKEVEKIGLPVTKPDNELKTLLWDVWKDFEQEMNCSVPFDPVQVALNDPTTAPLLGPVTQVQIPSNLPPQIAQAVFQNIVNQIGTVQVNPIESDLFQASLESRRCRSEFRTKLQISATRLPDMNIAVSVLRLAQGWNFTAN